MSLKTDEEIRAGSNIMYKYNTRDKEFDVIQYHKELSIRLTEFYHLLDVYKMYRETGQRQITLRNTEGTTSSRRNNTMKFAVAILVVLVAASPLDAYKLPSTGSGALANELQDIADLMPLHEMVELMKVYAAQDEQFRTVMGYMSNVETKEWVQFFEAAPQFVTLMNYVQNSGLDIYYLINKMNTVLDLPPLIQKLRAPLISSNVEITGGVDGFIADMAKLIPLQEVKNLFNEKIQNSKVVKDLVDQVRSNGYREFYFSLFDNVHYKRLENLAVTVGLDRQKFQTYVPILLATHVIIG